MVLDRRIASVVQAMRLAEVIESPLANNDTSCPCRTNSSVSQCTIRSVPP